MVAAVDLAMAVLAAAPDHARVLRAAAKLRRRALVSAEELPGVQGRRDVALLADVGTRRDEQLVVVRAVRRVAIHAALAHRLVLPQEGSALFGVARVAGLVHAVGAQQRPGRRSVR